MSVPRSVIVGIDFSESSRRALEVAIATASRLDRPLELVHAFHRPYLLGAAENVGEIETWIADQPALLEARLDSWRAEAEAAGVRATVQILLGAASSTIPARAREAARSLIVVGRRGSANLSHVLLGSVSERVVHTASAPVLVVPEQGPARVTPERLLVGVDFSNASSDAYRCAVEIADAMGLDRGVVLAHVLPGPQQEYLTSWSERVHPDDLPRDEDSVRRWAENELASSSLRKVVVASGRPDDRLLSLAAQEDCDWVVVGLHGRSALSALLMGSTTHRTLKLADRPILVVPPGLATLGDLTS